MLRINISTFLGRIVLFSLSLIFITCAHKTELSEGEDYINTENGKIWYRVMGSGSETPILCLHGGPGSNSRYFYQLSPISKKRPVIIFDQLGSGRSTNHNDTSILTVPDFVEQVKLVKQSLGLEEFYLLGQSWGSALALEYYNKYPDGIKALVFTGPFFSTELWSRDADTLISTLSDSVQTIIARAETQNDFNSKEYEYADSLYWATFGRRKPWPAHPLDTVELTLTKFVYNYMWGPSEFTARGTLKYYDNTAALKSVVIPTLFIAGQYDEARESTVRYFSSLVPDSKVKIIPDAGHSSMTDNPPAYIKDIESFINEVEY